MFVRVVHSLQRLQSPSSSRTSCRPAAPRGAPGGRSSSGGDNGFMVTLVAGCGGGLAGDDAAAGAGDLFGAAAARGKPSKPEGPPAAVVGRSRGATLGSSSRS